MLAIEGSSNRFLGLVSIIMIISMLASIFATGNAGMMTPAPPVVDDPLDVPASDIEVGSEVVETPSGTRQATTIYANSDTVTISGGEHTFYNFFAFNGSTVKIEDAKVTVKTADPFLDTMSNFNVTGETTTLEIINSEIDVEWGVFKADCKNISIVDSTIHVVNKTTQEDFEDYYKTSLVIRSRDHLTIKNSDIYSEAAEGNLDVKGGTATLTIGSSKGVTIMGKKANGVVSEGGKGGDQSRRRGGDSSRLESRAGRQGGEGKLNFEAGGHLVFMDTRVISQGGMGGLSNALGGKAYMDIAATGQAVSIIRSEVGTKAGLGSNYDSSRAETDYFSAEASAFKVDEPNYQATRNGPLSTVWGYSVTLNIPKPTPTAENCKLYNPYLKSVKTASTITLHSFDSNTVIQVMYWFSAKVLDNTGDPIEDAVVTVQDKNNFELGSANSDSNGIANFDIVEGYTITQEDPEGRNRLTVKATKFGVENEIKIFLTESTTEEIVLTLLTITLTGVNGQVPVNGMTVGCAVEFKGTTVRPAAAGSIDAVSVKVDGNTQTPGPTDTSADSSWAEWRYVWNSVSVTDGLHTLEFTVKLGSLSESTKVNVTVDQKSCNHPPEIIEITSPSDNVKLSISDAKRDTLISGKAFDVDFDSGIPATEGAKLKEVVIRITDSSGAQVLEEKLPDNVMDYDTVTGQYVWSYTWKTREDIEGYFKYPNGKYTVTITAVDTGGYISESWGTKNVTVEVYQLVPPIAILHKVNDEILIDERVVEDETKSKSIEFIFDGSESYDLDGNASHLKYQWDFGDGEILNWTDDAVVSHEYKINTKEKFQSWNVKLRVKDTDGLESSNRETNEVKIEVLYTPPPGDPEGWLYGVGGIELDLKSSTNLYIMIIIIVILNVVAASMMFLSLRKIEKQRAQQRALIEKQRKELEAEMAKERADAGYGDFSADYPVGAAKPTQAAQAPAQPPAKAQAPAAAAPKPAQPPAQVQAPVQPQVKPPAQQVEQLQSSSQQPAMQTGQQPAMQSQQKPVTTATVTTPGAQAPAQQVAVQQGTPRPPQSVGQDATAGMASYQVRQCPSCGGTVTAGWTECPNCKAKL